MADASKSRIYLIIKIMIATPALILLFSFVFQSSIPDRAYSYEPVVVTGTADIFYNRGETRLIVVSEDGVRTSLYCEAFSKWNRCLHAAGMGVKFRSGDNISAITLKPKSVLPTNNIIVGLRSDSHILMSVGDRATEIDISCKNIDRPLALRGWGDLGNLGQCL
jgi:hypothetical protein